MTKHGSGTHTGLAGDSPEGRPRRESKIPPAGAADVCPDVCPEACPASAPDLETDPETDPKMSSETGPKAGAKTAAATCLSTPSDVPGQDELSAGEDCPPVDARHADRAQTDGAQTDRPQSDGTADGVSARPRRWRSLCAWLVGILLAVLALLACAGGLLLWWASHDLPDLARLTGYRAPQATTVLARDGSVLGTICRERRYELALEDMPDQLVKAVLAIEDASFYLHPGVNPLAILRAFLVNLARGLKSQGGSTITQQLVKQLLLSSERSYVRKMKEALLATQLERRCTKEQILSLYLNFIYLGARSYGVEAASRTYFGKHVQSLTLAEAALIAGLPQAPSRYNPFVNPKAAKRRQLEVLRRLRELGWISDAEHDQAAQEPLVYWSMPESAPGPAQWYFEEARRLVCEFFSQATLRALDIEARSSGEEWVAQAGLTIQTAMDPLQQDLAARALRRGLEDLDKRQGWRGPKARLAEAERHAWETGHAFEPSELLGCAWVEALVQDISPRGLRVLLGKGYEGFIPHASMAWTRHVSAQSPLPREQAAIRPGDLVWVRLPRPDEQAEQTEAARLAEASRQEAPGRQSRHASSASKGKEKAGGKVARKTDGQADEKAGGSRSPGTKGRQNQGTSPAAGQAETASQTPAPWDPRTAKPGEPIPLRLEQKPLVQGALVSIEPQSGDVVALVGGYDAEASHFNRATQGRRQPGSAFKPVVYSAALDLGFTASSALLDAPYKLDDPATGEIWRPENADHRHLGPLALHEALAKSRNTPTARVAEIIGLANIETRARQLGIEAEFPESPSVCLGALSLSPINLTQSFVPFANQGLGVRPRIVVSVKDAEGRLLYSQAPFHWQAVSPQNAYLMASLLREAVVKGTGRKAAVEGLNIAGKTGTSNEARDAWFVGFSPYLATGVYIGFDRMQSLGAGESGGSLAAPVFRAYREQADQAYRDAPQDFARPPGIVMQGGLPFAGTPTQGFCAMQQEPPPALPQRELPEDTSKAAEELLRNAF